MTNEKTTRVIERLNQIKSGDMSAFDEFYQLTKYPIYYSVFALTKDDLVTEDILEETYLKFLNRLDQVKKNKNPLGYLLIIARNLALDYFKKENRVTSIEDYASESEIGAVVIEKYDDSERLLLRMQSLLTKEEYEIVILYVLSELTHKEIAKQLNKPLGTITWLYSNAIKKLKKGLSDYEQVE